MDDDASADFNEGEPNAYSRLISYGAMVSAFAAQATCYQKWTVC